MDDERATPPRSLDPALADQLIERPTDGDETAAVMGRELALRRQLIPGRPSPRIERGEQV
jgi:hypothetical protein